MPRKMIERYMPDHRKVREHRHLQCLSCFFHKPGLWRLNRRAVARAIAVGLFFAFVPVPFQMLLAASGAVMFNSNLPISVGMVWLTNPLTMPPIFYLAWLLGTWLMGMDTSGLSPDQFELSWTWLGSTLASGWKPFLLGCFVMGTVSALLGYLGMHLAWRFAVLHRWQRRRMSRRQAQAA
ncbi:MAG: DUF2062 domain-containing protein [Mariprofundaceae bacterium]